MTGGLVVLGVGLAVVGGFIVGIGVGLYPDYGSAQRLYIKRGYLPDGHGATYNYESNMGGLKRLNVRELPAHGPAGSRHLSGLDTAGHKRR